MEQLLSLVLEKTTSILLKISILGKPVAFAVPGEGFFKFILELRPGYVNPICLAAKFMFLFTRLLSF
jgi:hypothetical protein